MSDMHHSFPFQIIGFDLDGTLLDTSADLAAAVNHALCLEGRAPLSVAQVRKMIGGGVKLMLQHALEASGGCDEALLERLFQVFTDYYIDNICVYSKPYDGLFISLNKLSSMGVTLAVVTNKREALAVKLLTELDMIKHFACVIGGDTMGLGKSKPHPAPIHEMIARCGGGPKANKRAAFIGDSHFDIDAARNAGIPSIAVSFGFLTGAAKDLGADAVIDHYNTLIPALITLSERLHL